MKRPIKGLNVCTMNESDGKVTKGLGDRQPNAVKASVPGAFAVPAAVTAANTSAKPSSVSLRTVANIDPRDPQTTRLDYLPSKPSLIAGRPQEKKATLELAGTFVRDTIPDGSSYVSGARFTQVWTIKNPGPHTWPAGCSVRYVGGDNMLNLDEHAPSTAGAVAEASESNVIGREVKPGEEAAFKVLMKAPSRMGRAISYWRLKTADGTAFGHRLWCDIIVSASVDSADKVRVSNLVQQAPVPHPTVSYPISTACKPAPQVNCMPPQTPNYYSAYLERMRAMRAVDAASVRSHIAEQKSRKASDSSEKQAELAFMRAQYESAKRLHDDSDFQLSPKQVQPDASHLASLARRAGVPRGQDMWTKQMEDFVARTAAPASARTSGWATTCDLPTTSKAKSSGLFDTASVVEPPVVGATSAKKVEDASSTAVSTESPSRETEDLRGSQMVFPTLEKESPSSSIHESAEKSSAAKFAYVEDEETGKVTAAASTVQQPLDDTFSGLTTPEGFEDVASEIDILSADSEESDDGFLTDEEYDILDASDQETVF